MMDIDYDAMVGQIFGAVEGESFINLWHEDEAEKTIKHMVANNMKADRVHISGDLEDPAYWFWKLKKADVLADTAYVIFTGVKDEPCWGDFKMYPCVKFGLLFIMTCDSNTAPAVVPSQRGLFMS